MPQIQASVDTVAQQFGRLDILVNCVGMQREQTLLDVTEETFDEVLQVNLKAAMFLAQAVAKKQIAGGRAGAQVHLLSVRAQLGMRGRGYSAYCSGKNALVMLIRQHASELAPHGITVNGIAPTVVRTEMARHWLENPAPPCFSRRRRRRSSPARCCTWTAASRRRIRSSQQPTAASSPCVSTIRGRPTAPLPAY